MEGTKRREGECPCGHGAEDCCAGNQGFRCTLRKGHTGDHVACGALDHRLSVWASGDAAEDANERLRDAAPELFEALEDAEFLLRMLAERPEDLGAMRDSLKRCGDDARAALAKAKGDA